MGRPLNKKYFANTNYATFGTANVGGESIASVTAPAGTLGSLVNGTYTIPAASIGAPDIDGGAKPVLTVTVTGATAYTVTVVSRGSGYTTAPTITFAGSVAGGSGSATPVATLTSGASARQNGIKCEAQVPTVGEATTGDIIRQVSTRRYKVNVGGVVGICKLVTTASLNDNEMTITATDSIGATYYVTKLTGRRATLTQKTPVVTSPGGNTWTFITGASAPWTFGSAGSGTVQIENQ